MAVEQIKFLLMCACILVLQITTGVYGQCSTPPINLAVYEETPNTAMMCNSPTKVSWTLKPTTDELGTYKITNYDDIVTPTLTNLFGVNSASLNIKTAQSNATTPPISTAGLYLILINGSTTKFGGKLTVVRQPPTCDSSAFNSTQINMSCSLTYADSVYHPIAAKMTWTSNGNFFRNDTPVRSKVNAYYYVSTSVITVDSYDPANYQCTVIFAQPTNIQFAYVATNAPAFSATCNPPYSGYTTTQNPPTTTTTPPTTTTTPPTTTTTPPTTTTTPPTTTTTPPTTTTTPPTTTTTPPTTTTTPPTTTTTPPTTTTTPPTTTTTPPTTTTTPPTTTTTPPTTTTTPQTTTTTRPTTTTTPQTTSYLPTQTPTTSGPISATTTTECNCTQTASCPSPDTNCIPTNECPTVGTSLTNVYDECVVNAELYARCDNCCSEDLICGVVVTLRNDSRWLIHDPICDDNKCEMVVVDASCMSSGWKLLTEKKITTSGVGDYVQAGNSVYNGLNMTDCSDSCSRMMKLM